MVVPAAGLLGGGRGGHGQRSAQLALMGGLVQQQGRWEGSGLTGTVVPSGWRAAHLSSESESEVTSDSL